MPRPAGPMGTPEADHAASAWQSRFPLELIPEHLEPLTPRQVSRWVWAFLLLGIALRLVRYALRFPLWEDEAFLCANLLDQGFRDLTGALKYDQVCPIGFLWIELGLAKLLGFHEYSLRVWPLVCGVAGLLLFRHLAARFLKGSPLVIAAAIYAVAYALVRYSAEAKQYGTDLFVSLVLTSLAVEWWRQCPSERSEGSPLQPTLRFVQGGNNRLSRTETHQRWLWGLTALIPIAVGTSYPAVFVGGGISLFVAWVLWSGRQRRGWLGWVVYNVALVGSFAILFVVSAGHQSEKTLAFMQHFWRDAFPPLDNLPKLLVWLVDTHTSDLLAYPFGARHGGSILTAVCCGAGVAALCRRRHGAILVLWLAPLGLTFLAAALHRYPYGQIVKFQIYMAPAFCMLAGMGAALLVLARARGRRVLTVLLAALAVFGAGSMARDFCLPAKSAAVMRARDFARWFWVTAQFDGEVACLKTDLGQAFAPADYERGLSALYLCNQRIYSPRHARGEALRWDRVGKDRPLRCVEYRTTVHPYDAAARDRWLGAMQARYDLVGRQRFAFWLGERRGRAYRDLDYVEVYTFVPKGSVARSNGPETTRSTGLTRPKDPL